MDVTAGQRPLPYQVTVTFLISIIFLAGCDGQQSMLVASGTGARDALYLWWAMFIAATIIFLIVLVLLLYALLRKPELRRPVPAHYLIVGGGIIFPVVTLSFLVPFSMSMGRESYAVLPDDALTIHVEGRMWWWKIEYEDVRTNRRFTTANEIYLTAGEQVRLVMTSADIIHSLWVPRLAGKRDLFPGHESKLVIDADEPGVYRGQCAEFCGIAHALMAFYVVVVPPDEFDQWMEEQTAPARPIETDDIARGARKFNEHGCMICHAVRGHGAWGDDGPDLTHIGSRKTIGAGLMDNNRENLALWISRNQELKPGNHMPPYQYLDRETRLLIATYLESLK